MKISISLFLLVVLLTFCTDNDENIYTRPYPIVQTNSVTSVTFSTNRGEFNGEIVTSNGKQIQDHGFEYRRGGATYTSWYQSPVTRISLGALNGESKFSAKIPSISNPIGNSYSVRAYVEADGITVFGNLAYFKPW